MQIKVAWAKSKKLRFPRENGEIVTIAVLSFCRMLQIVLQIITNNYDLFLFYRQGSYFWLWNPDSISLKEQTADLLKTFLICHFLYRGQNRNVIPVIFPKESAQLLWISRRGRGIYWCPQQFCGCSAQLKNITNSDLCQEQTEGRRVI